MPTHVTGGRIHRADPSAPTKRWTGPAIAEADMVAVLDNQPRLAQPFRFAGGSTLADFVVGGRYWLLGDTERDGRRVWSLRVMEARQAGVDVMLVCDVSG